MYMLCEKNATKLSAGDFGFISFYNNNLVKTQILNWISEYLRKINYICSPVF